MKITRKALARRIVERIGKEKDVLQKQFRKTREEGIGYFYVDELLPREIALKITQVFPDVSEMGLKQSIRENKYVSAQMDKHSPLLSEVIYAFQEPEVVEIFQEITGISELYPDEFLYAGGLSSMGKGQFLNPHLDNSHDKDRQRWRALNLLYYVSPGWKRENGGNLELWPRGIESAPVVIPSLFNRLAVMETHNASWHSVSPVVVEARRNCISNYYFSPVPMRASDSFHVTSFRGRPEQKLRDKILLFDTKLRMFLRKLFPKGIIKPSLIYKKTKK